MNQQYAEAGVKKKDNMLTMAIRVLMIIGILAGIFVITMGSYFILIGMAIAAALIFLMPRLNIEYEYVFVDGQIDFDRIVAKSKRKTLLQVDMEQIEIVAPAGSHALDSYANIQLETKNFSSGDQSVKPYIIIASLEDKKYRIIFEPSEKMLAVMKQKSPRKISQV